MAYDEALAARVRALLAGRPGLAEKKMFGGLSFLLGERMCCGVLGEDLVVRLAPELGERALRERHVRPMDFTGRPLQGFVYVAPAGTRRARDLAKWVERGVAGAAAAKGRRSRKGGT